jgi:hypothetical protein
MSACIFIYLQCGTYGYTCETYIHARLYMKLHTCIQIRHEKYVQFIHTVVPFKVTIHTYTYIHTYTDTYMRLWNNLQTKIISTVHVVQVYTCIQTSTCLICIQAHFAYTYTHTYVLKYMYLHTDKHIHAWWCTKHVNRHLCTYVCMHVCMYVRVHTHTHSTERVDTCLCGYIHTYMHS